MSKFYNIVFIVLLFIFIIFNNTVFAVSTTEDIYNEIVTTQTQVQNRFVLHCLKPYINNTEYWQDCLYPIFDDITGYTYNFWIGDASFSDHTYWQIYLFHNIDTITTGTYTSTLTGNTETIQIANFTNVQRYTTNFYYATNSGNLISDTVNTFSKPRVVYSVKSDLMIEFINLINGGSNNYSPLLIAISNYLDDIDTVNNDILLELNDISSVLATIATNTSTDYSQSIGNINNKINDILSDNDTIISQNDEMIEQQEQINENLETVNDSIQDLKNTITDDTVETTAEDLPSIDVNDPSETGIDNIFQSIYNAFCTGEAQDIVFPIPFTDKNITLSPYYVRDMLNNNGAGWVYTLIQAFWGYLIGRYVVKDISRKITKVKSGNIENIENENIKEDML